MKKQLLAFTILSTVAFGLSGCMDDHKSPKHPGTYKSVETSTDANGTTTVKESTTEVVVDEYGNRKEVITSKTSKDPKGLMNKTSRKTVKTVDEK